MDKQPFTKPAEHCCLTKDVKMHLDKVKDGVLEALCQKIPFLGTNTLRVYQWGFVKFSRLLSVKKWLRVSMETRYFQLMLGELESLRDVPLRSRHTTVPLRREKKKKQAACPFSPQSDSKQLPSSTWMCVSFSRDNKNKKKIKKSFSFSAFFPKCSDSLQVFWLKVSPSPL